MPRSHNRPRHEDGGVSAGGRYSPTTTCLRTEFALPSHPDPIGTDRPGNCPDAPAVRRRHAGAAAGPRWAMRWKPALNAFAITFDGRIVPSGLN